MNERGIYDKYNVERTDGSSKPGGKHDGCAYFVLDLEHDEFAIAALKAYAKACRREYPALADDITTIIEAHQYEQDVRCNCREIGCPHSLGQSFAKGAAATAVDLMERSRKP